MQSSFYQRIAKALKNTSTDYEDNTYAKNNGTNQIN